MWGLLPLDKTAPGGFLPWGNFGSRREVESLELLGSSKAESIEVSGAAGRGRGNKRRWRRH